MATGPLGLDFLPIPALELIAIGVNIVIAGPFVGEARAALFSDLLTSTDILAADSAHAPFMQIIHVLILDLDAFNVMALRLVGGHCYG